MEGDLQDELDRLAAALGRGVSLDGPDGRLLGHSVQGADVDRARVEAILTRRVPVAARAWQDLHRASSAEHPVRVPASAEAGMSARLCVPVRRRGVVRALLWVLESDRPLDEEEVRLATAYAERVLALLPAERRPAPGTVPAAPSGTSARLATLLGQLLEAGPEEAERLVGTMADLDPTLPGASVDVAVVPGRSVALVRPGHPDVVHHRDRDAAAPVLAGRAAVRGFGASSVREALARADHAARCGRVDPRLVQEAEGGRAGWAGRTGVDGRVAWDGLGVWQLLLGVPEPVLVGWAGALAALAPAATSSGPMLLETLEAYLDLAGDAQRTAAHLTLHRTTLYYRLRRAADLLAVDLGDGAVRTRLHVALKAHRWQVGGAGGRA
ncbi:MAG: putative transcriptional regulator, PucR family [Marmoricola sp.]|nr:putative transcriptional regulator, PucR family [Marmoricola sp.]